MPRYKLPYSIIRRADTPYIYFKLPSWKSYQSTGTTSMDEAEKIVQAAYLESLATPAGPSLRDYADRYYIWDTCPHVKRLLSEGKSITRYHVKDMRRILENHVLTDAIAEMRLPEIKRAHVLDFRERLVEAMGFSRTVQKTMSVLKIILKEAFFREEIERDPTAGVGNTKYEKAVVGTFTEDELRTLFPSRVPDPWGDINAYAVFMTAAVTGMRRGEILALEWQHVNFTRGCFMIRQAWKDRHELGKPKWNKVRVTPLPESLLSALMHIRSLRRVYDDDLVFAHPDGSRLGGTWWQKNFRRCMASVGIDYEARNIRPHSFRHTLNSLLRERGYDSERIRASMGWSSVDVQDGYTHWSTSAFDGQREIVDSLFN